MSNVCTQYCFADWFNNAKPKERRLCEVYVNDLGPFKNETDKDLIQFLGYVPGSHHSTLVEGELGTPSMIRQDTFRFYGQPEALEDLKNKDRVSFGLVKIKAWCDEFEKYEVGWHPTYLKLADVLQQHGDHYHHDRIEKCVMQEISKESFIQRSGKGIF